MVEKAVKNSNWVAPAVGAATGIIGMLGQKKREKRAMKNQRELMDIQHRHQQQLNEQGAALQLQQWKDTNYPAQMKMLKEAGLNPSLLYGMGGTGGATTGSQGGGAAASGDAPAPQPMELGNAIQSATTAASIKLMDANADKARAEAENLRGGKGTLGESQIDLNKATALNQRTQADVNKLGLEIGNATKEDQIDRIHYEVEGMIKRNDLTDAEADKVRVETTAIGVKMQLDKANIKVSEETARKIGHDILLGWEQLSAKLQEIGVMNDLNAIRGLDGQTKLQEIQANFALGVLGKEIDLMQLNIEQQKIYASMFQGLFIGGSIGKVAPKNPPPMKGYR